MNNGHKLSCLLSYWHPRKLRRGEKEERIDEKRGKGERPRRNGLIKYHPTPNNKQEASILLWMDCSAYPVYIHRLLVGFCVQIL